MPQLDTLKWEVNHLQPDDGLFYVPISSQKPRCEVGQLYLFRRDEIPQRTSFYYNEESRKFRKVRWRLVCTEEQMLSDHDRMMEKVNKIMQEKVDGDN